MTASIVQVVPSLAARDAIGGHVLGIDDALRAAGVDTAIYAGHIEPHLAGRARPHTELTRVAPRPDRYLLYHSSIGSPVGEFVLDRPEPKLIDYHNLTPPEYFAAWRPEVFVELTAGRRQLARFAKVTELALADSAFNAGELVGLGFGRVCVVPILLDVSRFESKRSDRRERTRSRRTSGVGARWLFVGRVAPNKAQHDVVKAFAWYRRVFDAEASLTLVGGVSAGSYWSALERFVDGLGLSGVVRLAGSVADAELEGLYRSADVFVCLSEHEGFCVPLLEAMAHGVPVVALGAAAVPETLGDAGLVLGSKRPGLVAEAVHRVMGDAGLRAGLVGAGRRRLEQFALARDAPHAPRRPPTHPRTMNVRTVHQFVPTWEPGAVGAHALAVRQVLLDIGVRSEVFADDRKGGLPVEAHDFRAYGSSIEAFPDDLLMYHVAIGSEVAEFVAACPQRLIVDYHNLTPPEYFDAWDTRIGENLELGRDQLAGLVPVTSLALADSAFNAGELVGLGFGRVCVVPILLDVTRWETTAERPEGAERESTREWCWGAVVVCGAGGAEQGAARCGEGVCVVSAGV